jgi:hypothetical protein
MPVVVYLAGASREYERVRKWAAALEASELCTIADRWFDSAHLWAGNDERVSRLVQTTIAEREQAAVRRARIFWLLWPDQPSAGAFIELGYALSHRHYSAQHVEVVCSGERALESIFTATADFRSDSDVLAYDSVIECVERMLLEHAGKP